MKMIDDNDDEFDFVILIVILFGNFESYKCLDFSDSLRALIILTWQSDS